MTKKELQMYKRFAKEQLKKALGINIPMTRMILLEAGMTHGVADYAMIEDKKTHKEYQTWIGQAKECLPFECSFD